MIRMVLWFAVLVAVYMLTIGSLDPGDALVASVMAILVMVTFRRFFHFTRTISLPQFLRRTLAFIPFSLSVIWEIVTGSVTVAGIVLGLRPRPRGGLVLIPLEGRTRIGVAVTAFVMGLAPGSIWIGTDWEQGLMLFHMVDAEDPEAVREHTSHLYHRYQKAVFP